ncbi:DUF3450 domain-containing protein [Methylomarinum vadi]|uniref:DUF3450 domain-containing protein n=1 Tax=Methylomarinum vadi TaxID=438855 RepID=UPI001F352B7C|nr:DUF3450 domain-containing protein [Methylomarinum vadi]
MNTFRSIPMARGLLFVSGLLLANLTQADNPLNDSLKQQLSSQRQGIQAQQRIDKLDDQTQAMLEEFRGGSIRLDDLTAYNAQMERLIDDQQGEIGQKETQMRDIVVMQQQIAPFLQKMIDVLEEFVDLDVPFLPDERRQRIEQLTQLMHRSDVTVAEKYRRIMEAYRIEAEYGHNIEAYQGMLNDAADPRSVEFLRLGRTGLYYLTLKGDEAGYWDQQNKQWIKLDASMRESLEKAIRIAKKQSPPDLITLPVKSPEDAS